MESLPDILKPQYSVGPTNKIKHVSNFSLVAVRSYHFLILLCCIDFLCSGICLQCLQPREKQY